MSDAPTRVGMIDLGPIYGSGVYNRCAQAALATMIDYWRIPIPGVPKPWRGDADIIPWVASRWPPDTPDGRLGTTPLGVLSALNGLGFQNVNYQHSQAVDLGWGLIWHALQDQVAAGKPSIVLISGDLWGEPTQAHWAVVYGIDADHVYLEPPDGRGRRGVPYDAFLTAWALHEALVPALVLGLAGPFAAMFFQHVTFLYDPPQTAVRSFSASMAEAPTAKAPPTRWSELPDGPSFAVGCSEPSGFFTTKHLLVTPQWFVICPAHWLSGPEPSECAWIPMSLIADVSSTGLIHNGITVALDDGSDFSVKIENGAGDNAAKQISYLLGLGRSEA